MLVSFWLAAVVSSWSILAGASARPSGVLPGGANVVPPVLGVTRLDRGRLVALLRRLAP